MNAEVRQIPATILKIGDRQIHLQPQPATNCEACARGEGCGGGVFARLFARKPGEIVLPTASLASSFSPRPQPGEAVWLRISENTLTLIALWTWGAPVLALLLAAALYGGMGGMPGAVLGLSIFGVALFTPRYAAQALALGSLEVVSRPDGGARTGTTGRRFCSATVTSSPSRENAVKS